MDSWQKSKIRVKILKKYQFLLALTQIFDSSPTILLHPLGYTPAPPLAGSAGLVVTTCTED